MGGSESSRRSHHRSGQPGEVQINLCSSACVCVCLCVCMCVCVCMLMWWLFRYAVTRAECKYCCCVVCPQFVIGEIDVSDSENFLASPNIFDVAIKHGFFSPDYSRCDRSSSPAYIHTYIHTYSHCNPQRQADVQVSLLQSLRQRPTPQWLRLHPPSLVGKLISNTICN